MIDTHTHIYTEYFDDVDKYISESIEVGIARFIVAGTNYDTCIESINLSKKYDEVYAVIGVHPGEDSDYDCIESLIDNEKVIGIGEIGLDYYYEGYDEEDQKRKFRYLLDVAEKYNLPVVIHSREANNDTIKILSEYNLSGVIHSFSGTYEQAKTFIDMGYGIGVNGICTFNSANQLREIIKKIDIKNIVLETDAPYLAPTPYRGKENSSKYIPIIAEKIAEIKGISVEEVAKITTSNAYRIFDRMK